MLSQGSTNYSITKHGILVSPNPLKKTKQGHQLILPRQKNNNQNALANILEIKEIPHVSKKSVRKEQTATSQFEKDRNELIVRREFESVDLIQSKSMVHDVKMKLSEAYGAHTALKIYLPILLNAYEQAESAGLIREFQNTITEEQRKLLEEVSNWVGNGLNVVS